MDYEPINFAEKLGRIAERWQPRVVAELNDYQFKLVRLEGDFVWHRHADTDEAFIVLDGELRIDFRDGAVTLARGEMFVVPAGSMRRTRHSDDARGLCSFPLGTTYISPGPSVTAPSRKSMTSSPLTTMNVSSVSAWLCQTNSPCTRTILNW